MSADNRICVMCPHFDHQWYVWEGSASVKYNKPSDNSKIFPNKEEALKYAFELEQEIGFVEYGVEEISNEEIIESLRYEVQHLEDELKNPSYCPTCGACGEEGCCPPTQCKHGFCLHGDRYAKDYEWLKELTNKMYTRLNQLDPDGLSKIYDETWTNIYAKNEKKEEQLTFNI